MSRLGELPRTGRGLLALALVAMSVAGCFAREAPDHGNLSAPILVTGRVLDAGGTPIGRARLQLEVFDEANAQVGTRIPNVFEATFTASADGTFAIHLLPPPELALFSTSNGGFVNFHVLAISPDTSLVAPFAFSREIKAGLWVDEVPQIEIRALGGT